MVERIEFDPDSMTLGEVLAIEKASGEEFQTLIRSRAGQMAMAVFVQRLRSSGQPPRWNELLNLRLLDASSSLLGSEPANPGPK